MRFEFRWRAPMRFPTTAAASPGQLSLAHTECGDVLDATEPCAGLACLELRRGHALAYHVSKASPMRAYLLTLGRPSREKTLHATSLLQTRPRLPAPATWSDLERRSKFDASGSLFKSRFVPACGRG